MRVRKDSSCKTKPNQAVLVLPMTCGGVSALFKMRSVMGTAWRPPMIPPIHSSDSARSSFAVISTGNGQVSGL